MSDLVVIGALLLMGAFIIYRSYRPANWNFNFIEGLFTSKKTTTVITHDDNE